MIDKDLALRCDGCKKKLGEELTGRVAIVCPRCKRYNVFDTNEEYMSHKMLDLTSTKKV